MLSIKQKIILVYTFLFSILLLLICSSIYQTVKQSEIEKIDNELQSYSTLLQSEIEEQYLENDILNIVELRRLNTEGLHHVRINLYNKSGGNLLIDSAFVNTTKLRDIVIKNKNNIYNNRTFENKPYREIWSFVEIEGKEPLILQVSASMEDMSNQLNKLFIFFLIIIPLALIITGFIAYLISIIAFKPIINMINTAKDISINSLNKRIPLPRAKDEIYSLATSLNKMIERIDKAIKSHQQFIADASHELRTPLTIIQTELELAAAKISDIETIESIKTALIEVEGLNNLTSSLLTLAKVDAAQLTLNISSFRIDELLIESALSFKNIAKERKISIIFNITEPITITGDKDKIKSICINLIDNAIKYSFTDTNIFIDLNLLKESILIITIRNTGYLIKETEINKIFNRFYRSVNIPSEVTGSGLGLPICKELIEMHKGRIYVKSNENDGTAFIVEIPLAASINKDVKNNN
ncbi:MAG: HAMP domain-containing sensor histidine kinase [Bacteroidota bacterium]|nr:HAMP domain-containing sensor histidine kinase [Bacteroidota bacterium]